MAGGMELSLKSYFKALSWSILGLYHSSPFKSLQLALFSIANGLVPALLTLATGKFVQYLNTGEGHVLDVDRALFWLIAALCTLFAGLLLEIMQEYLQDCLSDDLTLYMQKLLYEHANKMDLAFFEDNSSLDKTFRVGKGSGTSSLLGPVQTAIDGCVGMIQAISLVGIMMYYALMPSILMVLTAIPIIIIQIMTIQQNYALHIQSTSRKRWGTYFTSLLTNDDSVISIRLLNIGKLMLDKFLSITDDINKDKKRIYQWKLKFISLAQLIFFITFSAVLIWMVYNIKSGELTAAAFIIFGLAAFRARTSMMKTIKTTLGAVNSTFVVNNIMEFLQAKPTILNVSNSALAIKNQDIIIENISFEYPNTSAPVIKNLSLTIPQGQTVALVGRNGAGKSTLMKLLCRLYDVNKGSISIGGQNIKTINSDTLYSIFSMVSQYPVKFEATIKENVAYGNWDKIHQNDALIEDALKHVGLIGYIQSLPKGIDTLIGKKFGDHTLSGGQWQKLAIARSLTRKSSIMIFDEPTSSLDPIAEQEIFRFISDMTQNQTLFFITHKFSTAKFADRIIVLDQGEIVEDGSHEDLLKAKGLYKYMHNSYFCVSNNKPADSKSADGCTA